MRAFTVHTRLCSISLTAAMLLVLAACGGGGGNVSSQLGSAGQGLSVAEGMAQSKGVGLLVTEDEIATLPAWQQELLSDPGWNQPYIAPRPGTELAAPTPEMLWEYTQREIERTGQLVPRGAGKSVSWTDQGAFDPAWGVFHGEYENVPRSGTPPFGCNNDDTNEYNGHALEDMVFAVPQPLSEVVSYVIRGSSAPNYFNATGGSGNDALSAVYQLFSNDINGVPSDQYSTAQFAEISYRADLSPGVGPGGTCNGPAFAVTDTFWKRFSSVYDAFPDGDSDGFPDEVPLYDVYIAPSGMRIPGQLSSVGTIGSFQPFYFGTMGNCYAGAWLTGIDSSANSSFNTIVQANAGLPTFVRPIYGLLLKRWLTAQPATAAGPWENWIGWPVMGPIALNNGQAVLDGAKGPYYLWAMWFERGFMYWVDYDQTSYSTPDEVQLYFYDGPHVYDMTTPGTYTPVAPTVYYGGNEPLATSVVVEAMRFNPGDPWEPVPYNNSGYYEVALPNSGVHQVEISMFAQPSGGVTNADCEYQFYIWAFRDGTIFGGDEATAQRVTHVYGSASDNLEGVYVVRVQVVDHDIPFVIAYGDSLPIHIGHVGGGGDFEEYDQQPEIICVTPGVWHDGSLTKGPKTYTWDGVGATTGRYPDQSSPDAYRNASAYANDIVTTSSPPRNDWINGNDVDFQFPGWYAYIGDPNGSLAGGVLDGDEVLAGYAGLLLDDGATADWTRADPAAGTYLDPSDPAWGVFPIGALEPVAGYYYATGGGDSGDEVRGYYGSDDRSLDFNSSVDQLTVEVIAHWPSGAWAGLPAVYWSMYPGHNMLVPGTTDEIPLDTPDGWAAYCRLFDVDPSVNPPGRAGTIWNRPQFNLTSGTASGRVVTFDYTLIPGWDPDFNHDGAKTIIDKFPVRCRIFTDFADYGGWLGTWPNHLQDPGTDPAIAGGLTYDGDFVEGGCYVMDWTESLDRWNLMFWMNGDQNLLAGSLAYYTYRELQELEKHGSTENINILVGYDITQGGAPFGWWIGKAGIGEVHFIKVVQDDDFNRVVTDGHPANVSFPKAGYDSADPDHIAEFVAWANANFPAEHSALVLMDHGNAWRLGNDYGRAPSGILMDVDAPGWGFRVTENYAIADALSPYHLDMLFLGACLMGNVESLYEYRDSADWLVGSEWIWWSAWYPWHYLMWGYDPDDYILWEWDDNYPLTPRQIGDMCVTKSISYYEWLSDPGAGIEYRMTHALYNSAAYDGGLTLALAQFASEVEGKAAAERTPFLAALDATIPMRHPIDESDIDGLRDLKNFLNNYRGLTVDVGVQARIDAALVEIDNLVMPSAGYYWPSQGAEQAPTGLSAWLPTIDKFTTGRKNQYRQLVFNTATDWLDMLEAIHAPPVPPGDWTHTWGMGGFEYAQGVASDAAGNVYVTGYTTSIPGGGDECFTLCYGSTGSLQWQRTWGGIISEYGQGIATDNSGNVYVTGHTDTFGAGSTDAFLLCYDTSGILQWQRTWGSGNFEYAYDVVTDSVGNVFVTGYTGLGPGTSAFLLCYDSSGSLQWQRTWGGPSLEFGYGVDADAAGNVYLSGRTDSFGAGNYDTFIVCYDNAGNLQWQRVWGGAGTEFYGDVAVDASGNCYITGSTNGFGVGLHDAFLLCYNSSGSLQWQRTWGGASGDEGFGVAADALGNVFVTGYGNSFGVTSLFALKYDAATGNLLDDQAWVHPSFSGGYLHGAAIAPDGALLCSGFGLNITGGVWQPLSGTAGTPVGTSSTPPGTSSTPSGSTSSPVGTQTTPTGVEDTGGGNNDALVLKHSM